ncbi:hypothetical protein PRNP1_001753 [Phytophthora ramorum]
MDITQVSMEAFAGSSTAGARVQDDMEPKVLFVPLMTCKQPTPSVRYSSRCTRTSGARCTACCRSRRATTAVAKFHFGMADSFSRGGFLADATGMRKTATMLALIAGEARNYADLLVGSSHLLAQ